MDSRDRGRQRSKAEAGLALGEELEGRQGAPSQPGP